MSLLSNWYQNYILAHQTRISAVFTNGKEKNRTATRQKINDVILMLRWHHHVMSHLSVFGNFREPFFNTKMLFLMVSKKKNPSFVSGWDRKTHPSRSPLGITRQASLCQVVILWTDFSVPTSIMMDAYSTFLHNFYQPLQHLISKVDIYFKYDH